MKQIFESLRGAILDKAFEGYNGQTLVDIHDVGNIINEAEAKWGKDCCIWKRSNKALLVSPHNPCSALWVADLKTYPYCNCCGKRIKISEVE